MKVKIFRGWIGRQIYEVEEFGKFLEVREVRKLRRPGILVELGVRNVRQDVLASNKCIFAT
jgi:hypothetical protein